MARGLCESRGCSAAFKHVLSALLFWVAKVWGPWNCKGASNFECRCLGSALLMLQARLRVTPSVSFPHIRHDVLRFWPGV